MKDQLIRVDSRRFLAIPGQEEETLAFAVDKWLEYAHESIMDHGFFAVALSGGSTPKRIFQLLSTPPIKEQLDWSRVLLFWSDERSVPMTHPDSNFNMAMEEGGLGHLPILKQHIFRMVAEEDIEMNAARYEHCLLEKLGPHPLDLVMLGLGEEGHTASLFPGTPALEIQDKLVVANYVPAKQTWRMTFTYPCINAARHICVYALGAPKAAIVAQVLTPHSKQTPPLPAYRIGTREHPALWILDSAAAHSYLRELQN